VLHHFIVELFANMFKTAPPGQYIPFLSISVSYLLYLYCAGVQPKPAKPNTLINKFLFSLLSSLYVITIIYFPT